MEIFCLMHFSSACFICVNALGQGKFKSFLTRRISLSDFMFPVEFVLGLSFSQQILKFVSLNYFFHFLFYSLVNSPSTPLPLYFWQVVLVLKKSSLGSKCICATIMGSIRKNNNEIIVLTCTSVNRPMSSEQQYLNHSLTKKDNISQQIKTVE